MLKGSVNFLDCKEICCPIYLYGTQNQFAYIHKLIRSEFVLIVKVCEELLRILAQKLHYIQNFAMLMFSK